MNPYDTVIWDLDGTLLNTLDDLADSVNAALKEVGATPHSTETIRTLIGNGYRTLFSRALPGGAEDPRLEAAMAAFDRYYPLHSADRTRPYEGILQVLRELKARGYAMAVVSNKEDFVVRDLVAHFFPDLISVAVGEQEHIPRKPAPDLVDAALSALGRTRERAVYIGDSEVDARTCQNAQATFIAALWGFRDRNALERAGAVQFAGKPMELLKLL